MKIKHTKPRHNNEVEELIDKWGEDLDNDAFLAALEDMIDRAQTALDARREELAGASDEES